MSAESPLPHVRRSLRVLALGAFALLTAAASQRGSGPHPSGDSAPVDSAVAFSNVTVIDVRDGRLVPDQTVVIVGNRIQTVGASGSIQLPQGTRVIDAKGKYLIPGLWDMHLHMESPSGLHDSTQKLEPGQRQTLGEQLFRIVIANGVTGVRLMAERYKGGADSFRVWQRDVMAGKRVGPRAIGPSADLTHDPRYDLGSDQEFIRYEDTPEDSAAVVRVIDSLKKAGDPFVKYHDNRMAAHLYFILMREARRVGLPVVGHFPKRVSGVDVADSGQLSIEHTPDTHCWLRPQDGQDEDAADAASEDGTLAVDTVIERQCTQVAQAFIRNGTWWVPTLHVHSFDERVIKRTQSVVRLLHRLGLKRIMAGTDANTLYANLLEADSGYALHHELRLLSGAGLTPLEVLQTATLNPAIFYHATDSLGTVEAGKLADLVLLDANPLTDIRNARAIRAVVANGRYFDRATLDTIGGPWRAAAPSASATGTSDTSNVAAEP